MGKFIKFKTMAADHGLSPPFFLYVNEKEKLFFLFISGSLEKNYNEIIKQMVIFSLTRCWMVKECQT